MSSNPINTNHDAEKKVLSKLVNCPNIVFDIEGQLKSDNFSTLISANIFSAIKEIATSNSNLQSTDPVDATILEEKIASLYPEYYKSQSKVVKDAIKNVFIETQPSNKDFVDLCRIVLTSSIKRKFNKRIEELKNEVEQMTMPDALTNHIECSTLDFTSSLFHSSSIDTLGFKFEDWVKNKVREVKQGNVHIGIKVGFPKYEECIGGGYRDGTINVIAARSKMGKSFLALTMADNVTRQGIPVLYLDTELNDEYQTIRRVARSTKIPLYQIEIGRFVGDNNRELLIKDAIEDLKKNKIYYVDIKGWSLEEQISIIRRFFSKIVGRNKDGRYNHCLVILDYLKLMSSSDKNSDKEYEALGYRMTALHDLMGEFQSPMMALAQQNRDGLEKEDESTISGSDRIIHYCDNFTIFSRIDEVEVMAAQANIANDPTAKRVQNCKFKIVCCRHGPGTKGKKYIGLYADIHDPSLKFDETCGIIEERGVTTITVNK